jgi:hypothetical protein
MEKTGSGTQGSVTAKDGVLNIDVPAGVTVWLRK